MARRRAAPRPRLGLVDGDCECWGHDHPHPPEWPWHYPSRLRFLAVDSEGRKVTPPTQEERHAALLDAGCTTCTDVAGGTMRDYRARMGLPPL
ncbi:MULTISPECIES: hypothetical protein [Pseudonocardia]|uniref:Uncharacterized protein n=2 Tax=Pseudonocardia TaxID=1847 RepID=A0A1Y2N926_PSEAH|nr:MULTISPECIES: hypothetical protein [Pseudonocardia]OSY43567.1 hypothetical protein BG845_00510 [Pseudonocardia autotrophica]TDN73442.1 hypothetical protein C8E95_2539 [Pseudonocardia autotrophica]BBG04181.1 hypothetical protein Pdca_53900 [Pseudonocardia autotrophica]GEC25512.1 hypothetical protein PSA01_25410 [Pseudonocardia saturnea]